MPRSAALAVDDRALDDRALDDGALDDGAAPGRAADLPVADDADPAVGTGTVPGRGGDAPTGCVTVAIGDDRSCVVRLRGPLARAAIARVEAVLEAVEATASAVVVDLLRARTRDRRLLRVIADVVVRRREAGLAITLVGVHPDVVPALEDASLAEAFLVYEAVCR